MKTKLSIDLLIKTPSVQKNSRNKLQKAIKATEVVLSDFLKTHSGIKKFEINLQLIGNARMKRINSLHRRKNKTTDVLSFPLEEDVRKLTKLKSDYLLLGDILIAEPVCRSQGRQFNISFEREFIHLLVHGFLHLIGHDHERSFRDDKIMFDLERFLLSKITKKLPNL